MLTTASRSAYSTLLDAVVLRPDAADRPALIYVASDAPPQVFTSAAFAAQTGRYANAMHALGLQPGELVLIAHTQNTESIFLFWAAMRLGVIPAMFPTLTEKLDPDLYREEMAALVRLSGVRALFTTDAFAPELAAHLPCPVYGSQALKDASTAQAAPPVPPIAPDSIAFLQHSSGTTGLQKGVALSHTAVLNQLASYADALALHDDDVIVSWLPLYHDMGLIAGFIQPLVQGLPLVLMSPFDWVRHPALLLRAIHDYHGTLCWQPNFAYNHLAQSVRQRDAAGLNLSHMRAFINCSEPARHDSHERFLARYAAGGIRPNQLAVSYAMAENTFAVTQTAPGAMPRLDRVSRHALQGAGQALPVLADADDAETLVSCGPPLHGVEVKVADESGRPLPERHIGEVFVRSDSMLTEYYRRPDLQPFDAEGFYHTGDRGYLADGEVYIVGRSKDLIIHAGKNIYPHDLEAIVSAVPGVHAGRAVVFGVVDAAEGTELIVIVAEVDAVEPEARRQIVTAIRQTITRRTGIPVHHLLLVERGWLIKTSSGKLARGKNRDKWLAWRHSNHPKESMS